MTRAYFGERTSVSWKPASLDRSVVCVSQVSELSPFEDACQKTRVPRKARARSGSEIVHNSAVQEACLAKERDRHG